MLLELFVHRMVSGVITTQMAVALILFSWAFLSPVFRRQHGIAAHLSGALALIDFGMLGSTAYWLLQWTEDGLMLASGSLAPPLEPSLFRIVAIGGYMWAWWLLTSGLQHKVLLRFGYVAVALVVAGQYAWLTA